MKPMSLLLSGICILLFQYAYCDIIPENSHAFQKCVKITNIEEYDNLNLAGFVQNMIGDDYSYIISSSDCLTKGYKFNSLTIFAFSSGYLVDKNLDEIDFANDPCALRSSIDIDPSGGYIHDSVPIERIEEFYKILGFTDTSFILFKWKEVTGYNNGLEDSVKIYSYTGDISMLSQETPSSIVEPDPSLGDIRLYPNPAENNLKADISSNYNGTIEIRLFSSNGTELYASKLTKATERIISQIPIESFAPGMYIIAFKAGNTIESKRFVIK
jgi:hypothetical protein